jgi:hypothetical protein
MQDMSVLNQSIGRVLVQELFADLRNVETFLIMVLCALAAQSVSLPEWQLQTGFECQAASTVRRFSRWLKNARCEALVWYAPLFYYAMREWNRKHPVILALDTTMYWGEFCAIRVSMIYLGRAVPVTWKVIRHKSSAVKYQVYASILDKAQKMLPNGARVTLLADRGFVSQRLMLHLRDLGWNWIIRVKGKQAICCNGKKLRPKMLQLRKGEVKFFTKGVCFGELKRLSFSAGWPKGGSEPWYVLSDLPAGPGIFVDYALRFDIEESFRDEKSGGFDLEGSKIRDERMLERMLLVLAVATIVAVSEGVFVIESGKQKEVDTHKSRGLSFFKIGASLDYQTNKQRNYEIGIAF